MEPAQRPRTPDPENMGEVGEKTLVGADLERDIPELDETPIAVPNVIDATIKVVSGGTVSNFKLNKDRLCTTIGSVREDCDIFVNDSRIGNKQLAIIQYRDVFVLCDCGVQDIVTFDGLPVRQVICPPGARAVVHMGKTTLIFSSSIGRKIAVGQEPLKRFHMEIEPTPELYPNAEIILAVGKDTEIRSTLNPILIGSHNDCDFTVRGESVRPFHTLVYWGLDGAYVMPLGTGSVLVNDIRIEDPVLLSEGDKIVVGTAVMTFQQSSDVARRCEAMFGGGKTAFEYIRFSAIGNSVSGSFLIPSVGQAIMIGRSASCHITMDDGACSREHVQIVPNGKSCQLFDNYSANGCYVNDEKISKVRVRAGDVVEIGRSIFIVHFD